MNINILYSVTALGFLLSLSSMLFIFLGKSIPGSDDKQQIIKVGWLEVKTNSAIGVLIASLIIAVLPLCLQTYLISIDKLQPLGISVYEQCESLKGDYHLHFNYIFSEKDGTRLVARRGTWGAIACEPNIDETIVALKGEDTTEFDIEIFDNGTYQLVATGTFNYPSKVLIGKNGKLISRTFDVARDSAKITKHFPAWIKLQELGSIPNDEYIEAKIDEALKIRADKHIGMVTNYCTPTYGEYGGRDILAFICQDYARIMVKKNFNL
jgi:hypothetical protein